MTERYINFSSPMVRANRREVDPKDVTRRMKGLKRINEAPDEWEYLGEIAFVSRGQFEFLNKDTGEFVTIKSTYGSPGDVLVCREAWRTLEEFDSRAPRDLPQSQTCMREAYIWYEADGPAPERFGKLRPAMFMCRWMVRDTAEVVSVRPERLLDGLTEAEAVREGVDPLFTQAEIHTPRYYAELDLKPMPWKNYLWHGHVGRTIKAKQAEAWDYQFASYRTARESYLSLWAAINGPGSAAKSPWIFRVEYRKRGDEC